MWHSIIIEDEPIATDILTSYIDESKMLTNKGCFINVDDAIKFMLSNHVDVIFLDIHLPGLKGNEFAKKIGQSKQIIFTTAYSEFAAEAFDLQAVDYLLKPFSFERFMQAISNLKKVENLIPNFIEFNENKRKYRVKYSDIIYIESFRDYCYIHLSASDTIHTRSTMSALIDKLHPYGFVRIHKSYIINTALVSIITSNEVKISTFTLPIGRNFKGVLG